MAISFYSQVFSRKSDTGPNPDQSMVSLRITHDHKYEDSVDIKLHRLAIYYRVSTTTKKDFLDKDGKKQQKYRQTIESQKLAVEEWLAKEHKFTAEQIAKLNKSGRIYVDYYTGMSEARPELQKLKEHCALGKIDNVVVFKLCRLSRRALTAIRLVLDFQQLNIGFISTSQKSLNLGTDNPFRFTQLAMLSEFAQLEYENIRERVMYGQAAARKRLRAEGRDLGRPQKYKDLEEQIIELFEKKFTIREIAKKLSKISDIKKSTVGVIIARYNKAKIIAV